MGLLENVKVALRAVRSNLLRTVLTLLIIALGITALVGILTAIDSAIYALNDSFSSMGANSFSFRPKGTDGSSGRRNGRVQKKGDVISFAQATAFKERFNFPATIAISTFGTGIATIKHENEKTNPNVRIEGIDENYLDVKGLDVEFGRNFTNLEVSNGGHKAIIGMDIVKKLFNNKADLALNKMISVGGVKYKVIGVLASKGSSMGGSDDLKVLIPLMNAKRYYGHSEKDYRLEVSLTNADEMEPGVASSIGLFRNIRKLKAAEDNDFEIRKSDGLIAIITENTASLRLTAVGIAVITLLGAAIGLMNIMLVSVTERTREIGICKAIGATRRNIMIQFLAEAVVICQLGGILGVILGVCIGYSVTYVMGGSFVIPWAWITVGIIVCVGVGLISGLYPALKASRLDPIESLRYE
ncbi:MAG: ABC transporter permease [Saprospiraceae bacterium]